LKSLESIVSEDNDRPTAVFSFDLSETGLEYDVGDHLAVLPRNPQTTVERVIELYSPELTGNEVLSVEPVDPLGDLPFPSTLNTRELLTQYLDLSGRPSRNFLRQLLVFARSKAARNQLRALCEPKNDDNAEDLLESYTADNTYADVLCEFAETALPPFEYLLSMVPVITPRLYSIASSPLYQKDRLDLLVVLNQWNDGKGRTRTGLTTQNLFGMEEDDLVAIQIKKGLLQPPMDLTAPILMFGLGTGVAPFRGFLQHRQALMDQGATLGPATLYLQCRHKNKDFYLEKDWNKWLETGALTNLHTVFSRDIPGKRGRIADEIKEHPFDMAEALQLDVKSWKDSHVHAYYCGPAMGIPDRIQESMEAAITNCLTEQDARDFMERLVKKDEHFHVECF
jgi:sulfite reductase alpha subunit-like flavoprotein